MAASNGECVIPRRILILLHESDPYPDGPSYFIWGLRDAWLEMGLDVRVVKGPGALEPADLVIPHVDLTVTPPAYRAALDVLPNVANTGLYDISKRRVSTQLVDPGDAWEGPVIVKTDRNACGLPERLNAFRESWLMRRTPARVWRMLTMLSNARALSPFRRAVGRGPYALFDSMSEVPAEALADPSLVVERFLPELEDGYYHVRWYIFIGDRYRSMRVGATHPVVKLTGIARREVGLPVPPEVVAFRERRGLDFGKIDYVVHQGMPIILDLNRTPGDQPPPERLALCRPYASGVLPLLERRSGRVSPLVHQDVDA